MSDKIYVRRGLRADLPALASGEPGWCTDTKELFVGTGSGNERIRFPSSHVNASQSVAQSITSGVSTKLLYQTEATDLLTEYDPTTSLFTARYAGKYLIHASVLLTSLTDAGRAGLFAFVNGSSSYYMGDYKVGATGDYVVIGTTQIPLNANDTLAAYINITNSTTSIASPTAGVLSITRIA